MPTAAYIFDGDSPRVLRFDEQLISGGALQTLRAVDITGLPQELLLLDRAEKPTSSAPCRNERIYFFNSVDAAKNYRRWGATGDGLNAKGVE